ncbi:MAG: elongation factor 4 [Candidatus Omnitrophica bacterium]|nr:elongation factor 4 [Candidatus Omnitrophota bacterium]
MDQSLIRNFCIIAHIDHGKSTLADRLLQMSGAVEDRNFRDQILDDMDLERERGITIKASSVRLPYKADDGREYVLDLIDTPGHVDFSFEVTKSLQACEGTLLVVDAAQGVEAQTVANFLLAYEKGLTVLPVINKVDLGHAQVERTAHEIQQLMQDPDVVITPVSAKAGLGIHELFERIVREIPPPTGDPAAPLSALVFDSTYDSYKGIIVFVRIVEGTLRRGMTIVFMGRAAKFQVQELGIATPGPQPVDSLSAGEVGYLTATIRDPHDVIPGDTVTETDRPAAAPLPGFRRLKPMVFAGIYPSSTQELNTLRTAMEKFVLTDAAFQFSPEHSEALGQGFRCGFLGLLHMEIVQERLEREYNVDLVLTTPSVVYQVTKRNGQTMEIDSPAKMPSAMEIAQIQEPYVQAVLLMPADCLSVAMELVKHKRGTHRSTEFLSETRVKLMVELPLSEILVDFYDKLKSLSRGYGSFDYDLVGFRPANLVRLDILINGDMCEPLSMLVVKEKAHERGKAMVERLKGLIPRQLFEVAVQAAIGSHIVARDSIRALAKNVTGKCYGGDITRKRKLWDKQKEGKKRMKQFGRVEIPQEAFLAALKLS